MAESRGDQLGASLHRDRTGKILGTTFRVWAPHAKTVAVIGEFNHWRPKADEMTLDGATGVWSSGLTKAKPGGEYMFLINGELERRDPRGRELSESGGRCLGGFIQKISWSKIEQFIQSTTYSAAATARHVLGSADPSHRQSDSQ